MKEKNKMKHLIIAVDFDGTIVEHKYPSIGKEIPNSLYFLKKLKEMHHILIMWTCREGKELQEAVDYCKSRGLEFDAVNENIVDFGNNLAKHKILFDLSIDDKNMDAKIDWTYIYKKVLEIANKD